MRDKFFTNLAYVAIAATIIGQCVTGVNFYYGQFAYLIANIINCGRDIALDRPKADKIKNFSLLGITIGIMIFKHFD